MGWYLNLQGKFRQIGNQSRIQYCFFTSLRSWLPGNEAGNEGHDTKRELNRYFFGSEGDPCFYRLPINWIAAGRCDQGTETQGFLTNNLSPQLQG